MQSSVRASGPLLRCGRGGTHDGGTHRPVGGRVEARHGGEHAQRAILAPASREHVAAGEGIQVENAEPLGSLLGWKPYRTVIQWAVEKA